MTQGNGRGSNGHAAARKSVIDEGTTFKGVIAGGSTVVVLGVLEGEVSGPAVEVDRGGVLIGKAKVTELRSRGELAGEFEADDVELYGRVRDQTVIRAKALLVGGGDTLHGDGEASFGECLIEVGEPPSKEQAIREAIANGKPDLGASGPVPIPMVITPVAPPAPEATSEPPTGNVVEGETQAYGAVANKKKRPGTDRPIEGA